mgnify:CR=1 FL=1
MANLGPLGVNFQVTTASSTASFRDITAQVLSWTGLGFEANLEDGQAFGISWQTMLFSQFSKIQEITLNTLYDDDTSTGVRGFFMNATDVGTEKVMKLDFGTTNAYPKFDFLVKSARVLPARSELIKTEIVLQPTGAPSVVTT